MLKTILFDYGGTLDTAARHWSYVLWDGYRVAGVTLSEADFPESPLRITSTGALTR